jgi:signal transduction histidine kinase
VVANLTQDRGIDTTVHLAGPMSTVGADIAEHAEAVTAEAVSNSVRHSGATLLTVEVTVADQFTLEITDNGRGIPADNQRRSGLANMLRRAEQVGGSCQVTTPPEGGTKVLWTAPLPDA